MADVTDADLAFAAAEVEIASVADSNRDVLDLNAPRFRELAVLPPALANLTQLRVVELDYTKVSDLTPLVGLSELRHLFAKRVPVRDLSPIANLHKLTRLTLSQTHVDDLSALRNLTGLTLLTLDRTEVSDVSPLVELKTLSSLSIDHTEIADLSPLLSLPRLWDGSGVLGVSFDNGAATRADTKLAEIARIPDKAERAQALKAHLLG